MKQHLRYVSLVAMLMIQSCSAAAVATPTLEQPSPAPPTSTVEIQEATLSPAIEPPTGFKRYQDSVVGVSVYVPESWVVVEVDPGRLAILQSYPEDKYIGGEVFKPGTRIEVDSLGRSISLITEVNERTVVLACFGELAPFDEIAVTLRANE